MKINPSSSILVKVFVMISSFAFIFMLFLFATSALYVQGTLKHIDDVSLIEKSNRLSEVFQSELTSQSTIAKNWGVWDDLYEYVKKPNVKFEKANLGEQNIDDLPGNFVMIFGTDKKMISFASREKSEVPLKSYFEENSTALSQSNRTKISKELYEHTVIENINGRYIVYAMHPIVKSDKTGEADGTVVFARWLNDGFYTNVSKLFGSKVTQTSLNGLPKGVALSAANKLSWTDVNDSEKDVYVYYANADVPFALAYKFKRDFYSYGLDMLRKFTLVGALFIAVSSVILYWFLKNKILSRLIEMSRSMGRVGLGSEKVFIHHDKRQSDEIEQMAVSANMMLERMYGYQDSLSHRSEELSGQVKDKIDELRQKDAAIFRQSKFVTIGETISNISHQWRQPLNDLWLIIQSVASKYKTGKLDQAKFDEFMAESKKLISYMSDTIEDFQTFSKPDKDRVGFYVNDMIDRAITIANSSLLNNSIKVVKNEDGRYMAYGVPNEFAQAILNIINNARDAFKGKNVPDKTIFIDIVNVGGMIVVTIEDNAGGIDEAVLETIFEPYVSTKYGNGGTGIGLYITKMAIEQCDGSTIDATNGEHGAVFNIVMQEINN